MNLCWCKISIDNLTIICRLLGTPNEDVWPGVTELPYWKTEAPKFKPKDLSNVIPGLDDCGCDLLWVSFCTNK